MTSNTSLESCEAFSPAFSKSAEIYDLIHAGKDYDGEAKRVLELLGPVGGHLADWGAGTGEFTRRFVAAGWSTVGIDNSRTMVDAMFKKRLYFLEMSMTDRHFAHEAAFKAQTCLFAAFSYASAAHPPLLILENLRRAAAAGGKLVFDFVNADAYLRDEQIREVGKGEKRFCVRQRKRLVDMRLIENLVRYTPIGNRDGAWVEMHYLRTFTRREIAELISRAGWKLEKIVALSHPPEAAPGMDHQEPYYLTAVCSAA